ncbi:MAG: glycosyltransferase [Bacteroidaceae bacterium]|nr:glycosyltransferase [Bacteroidaceae bacterium]
MKHLHVISFQNPYPPTYGGVIDVYFRIKALHQLGWGITLHTFTYDDRKELSAELKNITRRIYTYPRKRKFADIFSLKPFIVKTRNCTELLHNLCNDDSPILFEGLHTTSLLAHPKLKDRIKIVRAHNIEHNYYQGLAKASKIPLKRAYYIAEAQKLQHYESILEHANLIAAISKEDHKYFANKFGNDKCFFLPPAFDYDLCKTANATKQPFVLYNANFAVAENAHAALWICKNVATISSEVQFVLAGANPSKSLQNVCDKSSNIKLSPNPSSQEMTELLSTAKVSLLVTFQSTGMKLKLLHTLASGSIIIANSAMIEGTGLEQECIIADTPQAMANAIREAMSSNQHKQSKIPDLYMPEVACQLLSERILSYHQTK